jgi:uncharacterized membrane protein YhaH (DUF805 family)
MKGALWWVLGVLGLIWSALAWFIYSLAGAGGAAVVSVTRWLDIDPSATQWLADGLALAGGVAQWLVVFGWLFGVVILGIIGWVAGRAETAVRKASLHAEMAYGEPALEGEIHYKKVSETSRTDGKIG